MVEWSAEHAEDAAISQLAEFLYELLELSGEKCERIARRIIALADKDWDGEE